MEPPDSGVLAAASGLVPVDYHQFYLIDGDFLNSSFPRWTVNGLVDSDCPGCAVVHTGIAMGDARLTVEARTGPPAPASVSLTAWDAIAEISLEAPHGHLAVQPLMNPLEDDFPVLTPAGPGTYRVRVHARGRDSNYDLAVSEPCEDYLVQVWPAPVTPGRVFRLADRYGTMSMVYGEAPPA